AHYSYFQNATKDSEVVGIEIEPQGKNNTDAGNYNKNRYIAEDSYTKEHNSEQNYEFLYRRGNHTAELRSSTELRHRSIDIKQTTNRYAGHKDGAVPRQPITFGRMAEKAFQNRLIEKELTSNFNLVRAAAIGHPEAYDRNISSLVFMTIIVDFMDVSECNIRFLRLFKSFCTFLPKTLISGFIYMRRYASNFDHRFKRVDQLIKTYLACCILANKYNTDVQLFNVDVISGWDIDISEMNYCEALVLNTLNYNLFISSKEYECLFSYIQRKGSSLYGDLGGLSGFKNQCGFINKI
ncbi:hypothetical protein PAEPH01_2780, partial [Pancytospora epiphaga]